MADNDDTERWLPVVGYEGLYTVSDKGRVRSLDRTVTDKNGRRMRVSGRVMVPQPDETGRVHVALSNCGAVKIRRVHVLVLEAFAGPRPEGFHACHNDGDASNNILSNLRWDTVSENNYDLTRHGTHWNGRKTHCDHGHEFTPENTIHPKYKPGRRKCRECGRIANRKSSAKRRLRERARKSKNE